jgi:hypothetical protein
MGFGRVVWTGIVGMIFLVLTSWISFSLLDLTGSITGGLITDLNTALGALGSLLPGIGPFLGILASIFLGLFMILLFPIHWCLFYRPDDVYLMISVILPWILTCSFIAAIGSHSPRGGLHSSLAVGIGFIIITLILYFLIPMIPAVGPIIGGVIDGLSSGLTDLPFVFATLTAILEGCLIGGVFGAFIGSLRYKGAKGGKEKKGKAKKSKSEAVDEKEPTLDDSEFCTNCGAKVPPGNDFCTNCGAKMI